jgi:hypothetical protein
MFENMYVYLGWHRELFRLSIKLYKVQTCGSGHVTFALIVAEDNDELILPVTWGYDCLFVSPIYQTILHMELRRMFVLKARGMPFYDMYVSVYFSSWYLSGLGNVRVTFEPNTAKGPVLVFYQTSKVALANWRASSLAC